MAELELSVMSRGAATEENLRELLEPFEVETGTRVRLRILSWDTAWADLLKVALYQYGPDVSEIGSTWLSSLAAMNALESLTSFRSVAYGDAAAYLPACWQSGLQAQQPGMPPLVWGVPWWADVRLLLYRRDLLAQAGIDEQSAFASMGCLEETLQRLRAAGVTVPWVVPTQRSRMTVHNAASWVWGAGGQFVSDDGRQALFHQPAARAGLTAYLGLGRFLAELARGLDDDESDALYASGQAAVTISGPWVLRDRSTDPHVAANTGVTLPPGVPFVGGSMLVLWKHALHDMAAVKLIRFLTSPTFEVAYGRRTGLLPTRLDVLSSPALADNPQYQVVVQGLRTGRAFPSVPLWGLVEEKLNEAVCQLWAELLAGPDLDLEKTVTGRLELLARKLNLAMRNR